MRRAGEPGRGRYGARPSLPGRSGVPAPSARAREPDGGPWYPDDITQEFNRLVAACGLPKIRLHDLRQNVASLLLATGMPFASVMKITGHDEETLKKI